MKENYIIPILILCLSVNVFAQGLQLPTTVQAPSTANLGKYGDVPVSLYSGVPNISVPIYTMEQSGLKLDISLDYDASGVMVNSVPGWIGQNWSLTAGGVVTREVRGGIDEYKHIGTTGEIIGMGFFYPEISSRFSTVNWSTLTGLANIYTLTRFGAPLGSSTPTSTLGDSEPDVFTFNFMGKTGKFFMGEDGVYKVASDSNLKIKILESDFKFPFDLEFTDIDFSQRQVKQIGKIEIIDDAGITYTFGGTPTSVEYSKDFMNQRTSRWDANAWYLTKVTDHLNKILFVLDYTRDNNGTNGANNVYSATFYNSQMWSSYKHIYNASGILSSTSPGCFYSGGSGPQMGGFLLSPVTLTKITSRSNEVINFTSGYSNSVYYESNAFNIHDISNEILNKYNQNPTNFSTDFYHLMPYTTAVELVNKLKYKKLTQISGAVSVVFNFNEPAYTGQHANRFCLNSLVINSQKQYSFTYDQLEQLPKLMSKAIDHLGYFRGTEYPQGASLNFSTHFNFRTTNATSVFYGSLKRITYPTKGYSEFLYEPHLYKQYVTNSRNLASLSNNTIIGGLRVKSVTHNDGMTSSIKEFKYLKDYNINHSTTVSSGILNMMPKYHWVDWTMADGNGNTLTEDHFSINPLLPMSNFFGSAMGYSEVAEVNSDGSYTIYKYTSNENLRDEILPTNYTSDFSPYGKYSDRSLLRGKLLETAIYNASNVMQKKVVNMYETPETTKFARASNVSGVACPGNWGNGFYTGNGYKLFYYDYQSIKEVVTEVFGGQPLINETSFVYQYIPTMTDSFGDRLLMSKSAQVYLSSGTSGEEKTVEYYSYPQQLPSTVNTDMIARRLFVKLQTELKRNTETLSKSQLEYGYFPNLSPSVPMPKRFFKSKGANMLELETEIDAVDAMGNITQHHQANGRYTTIGWSYNKNFPVIKFEGTQLSSSNLTYIESQMTQIQGLLGTNLENWSSQQTQILQILQNLRNTYQTSQNQFVNLYTYGSNRLWGPISVTSQNGYKMTYEYDASGNLKYVRDAANNIVTGNNYNYKP